MIIPINCITPLVIIISLAAQANSQFINCILYYTPCKNLCGSVRFTTSEYCTITRYWFFFIPCTTRCQCSLYGTGVTTETSTSTSTATSTSTSTSTLTSTSKVKTNKFAVNKVKRNAPLSLDSNDSLTTTTSPVDASKGTKSKTATISLDQPTDNGNIPSPFLVVPYKTDLKKLYESTKLADIITQGVGFNPNETLGFMKNRIKSLKASIKDTLQLPKGVSIKEAISSSNDTLASISSQIFTSTSNDALVNFLNQISANTPDDTLLDISIELLASISILSPSLIEGLVDYWDFNGNTYDLNTQYTLPGLFEYVADRNDNQNSAINFNGSFAIIPNCFGASYIKSISLWILVTSNLNESQTIFDINGFSLSIVNGKLQYADTVLKDKPSKNAIKRIDTKWTHIATTVDVDSTNVYVNGDLIWTGSYILKSVQSNECTFGSTDSSWSLNAYLDDVFFYNRALSGEEVLNIMKITT